MKFIVLGLSCICLSGCMTAIEKQWRENNPEPPSVSKSNYTYMGESKNSTIAVQNGNGKQEVLSVREWKTSPNSNTTNVFITNSNGGSSRFTVQSFKY